MDIPKRKDSEKSRLIRENSTVTYLSQSAVASNHYYGTTPNSLKIPNVNSITDLNEIERAFNSYNDEDQLIPTQQTTLTSRKSIQLSQSLKKHLSRPSNNNNNNINNINNNIQYDPNGNNNPIFRMDSEASTSSNNNNQFTNSNLTNSNKTRRMSNFVSSVSQSYNGGGDTNSLYNYMREQRKNTKAQIFESLDYEINENVLYLMEKKQNLRSKQNGSKFSKYLYSFFPSQKEASRWFIIFLIGTFTALTACFIVVNVEYFSELKYEKLRSLFNGYVIKSKILNSTSNSLNSDDNHIGIFNKSSINTNDSFHLDMDKTTFKDKIFKLQVPLMFWFLTNAIPIFLGSVLVTYLAPVSAGSGIPVIKCYLNGVKVPEVVRIKTYLAKMFGVICTVVGGLCSGKEGPLIHCGSVIAAGLSQGKSTTLKTDLKVFRYFREDHEKRDFVSAGAAAGVAGAFGAPVGGVLFSLEEGASFWNQILTWRIFFCSLISTFTLNFIYSAIQGKIGQMSFPGLISFGKFDNISYNILEIPVFIFIGCSGGLIGALFNSINYRITVFRMKYLKNRQIKVLEAVFISLLTALVGFLLIISSSECRSFEDLTDRKKIKFPLQLNCGENEFSTMGSLFLSNAESVTVNMFHLDAKIYSINTLCIYFVIYFLLSVVTYGLSLSSGIFIPALLIGSVFGRIIALISFNSLSTFIDIPNINELSSKFALIGAASVLGGIVRMTLSLTVILIETTGNLSLGLPLMICLIFSKWIGDICNEGLYDIHIKLQQIPFLACEPHLNNHEIDEDETIFIQQIMSTPVVTLNKVEKVRNIVLILQNETHYGFPIVDCSCGCANKDDCTKHQFTSSTRLNEDLLKEEQEIDQISADYTNLNQLKEADDYISRMRMNRAIGHYGKLRGFVLRWQLIVLLQKKIFNDYIDSNQVKINSDIFRDAYPRYDNINKVVGSLLEHEMDFKVDLGYIMNPSPYSVRSNCSFERTFRLFRALGLRHLCVTDDSNNVVGIVTRKDISHFKIITHRNKRYIQKYSETLH